MFTVAVHPKVPSIMPGLLKHLLKYKSQLILIYPFEINSIIVPLIQSKKLRLINVHSFFQ